MRVINVITAGPQGPPGPQGPQGPAGSGSIDSGSFATTSSLNALTASIDSLTAATSSYVLNSYTGSMSVLSASYAESSSLADVALGAYYSTQALNSTFADTASYALQALNSTLADTASYALLSETSSFVQLIQGPGITVNGLEITASVLSVNGIFPTNGNISTALTATITGTSASLVISSSGNVTGSIPDGLVWIISGDPTPANNGDTYIFSSGSVGQWYPISTLDVASGDARYLKLDASNDPMGGNLDMGGYNITNIGTLIGTASYASQALTASYAIGAQAFPFTGSALVTGSLGVTGSISTTANINLLNTTSSAVGIINKGGLRFLHDFKHATGGTAIPVGKNVMLGENAGNFTMGSTATATFHSSNNVLVGSTAGNLLTIGYNNVFNGSNAGLNTTTGYSNVFVGLSAGGNVTTGYFNVYLGDRAGLSAVSSTGYQNVGIGTLSLASNTTGFTNVFIGHSAGQSNTTGFQNAAIHGGGGNTTGYNNVFVGYNAGGSLANGTANQTSNTSVFLGANTKALSAGNANQIVIGNNVTGSGSNTVTIGDTSITNNYFNGCLNVRGLAGGNILNLVNSANTTALQVDNSNARLLARSINLTTPTYTFLTGTTYGLGQTGTQVSLIANSTAVIAASSTTLTIANGVNFSFNTTTGTKIGSATTEKLSFWNATPIVQPTTATTSATLVSGGGTTLTNTDTFDGYTLQQVVKALRNAGLLA